MGKPEGRTRCSAFFADSAGFANNAFRCLVVSQPAKRCVPQIAVGRPGAELHLRHQLRFDKHQVAACKRTEVVIERARFLYQSLELVVKLSRNGFTEAGPNAANMVQFAIFKDTHGQRADGITHRR